MFALGYNIIVYVSAKIKLKRRYAGVFYCCGLTDTGTVRDHNEDAFLINKRVVTRSHKEYRMEAPMVTAVADGVAGEASGEIASRIALELLSSVKPSPDIDYKQKIMSIHRVLQKFGISHHTENMQTTLCALAVEPDGKAVMINIGDSRMYRYRAGRIKQLSRDQSLVQILYEQGQITPEQRINHARKNVILPVLGNLTEDPDPQIEYIPDGFSHGDIMIMCSDGLSDHLTSGEFENILAQPKKLPLRLSDMVESAKLNGSEDNITVAAITYLETDQENSGAAHYGFLK